MAYRVIYSFFYILSRLPLGMLYLIADFEYFLLYHVVRYRRKIVRKNLTEAFPEKGREEIVRIEKEFYLWFSDYFFETIKLLSIDKKELRKRFVVTNSEVIEECFEKGQNVAAILGHYCNWEWLSCVGIDLKPERKIGLIYHPLRNEAFDKLFKKIRSSQNGVPIPKKEILRFLVDYRRKGLMSIFGYISDQSPKWTNIHLWLRFLNHDTPVFTGGERIMRKMKDAVFYVEMERPKRGHYRATYRLITKAPQNLPPFEVTKRFFSMLEETIKKKPQYYLWTHNRWKRTHEEFDRRFEIVNGKVVKRTKEELENLKQASGQQPNKDQEKPCEKA